LRAATPTELAERHQRALARCGCPAILIQSEEQARNVLVEAKRRNFEWQVQRGVYVPLTAEELARLGIPVGGDDEFPHQDLSGGISSR
jgi:hypothetical protein